MVTFSNPAYTVIFTLQLFHLAVDLLINASTIIVATKNPVILLILYLIQDIGLVFAIIFIFLNFFNTYIFRAGLLPLLMWKFSATLIMCGLYFVLTLGYHIWSLSLQWREPHSFVWNGGLQTVYVFQRMLSVVYYYAYKRTAFRLGNVRYYEDSQWLRKHLNMR